MTNFKIPEWRSIHTLVFDFDGIFTDNKVFVDQDGKESVRCDRADGLAFDILRNSKPNKKNKFEFNVDEWGIDFQSEHERFLVEKYFKNPVIVKDYPKKIKAFYMRSNDDNKTVAAMDVLFPNVGEIIGGSQREERLDDLSMRMEEMNISKEDLNWYLDTRRFGSVVHSGFGLGLERLVQFITGMKNIRDVIPFPRTPGNCNY